MAGALYEENAILSTEPFDILLDSSLRLGYSNRNSNDRVWVGQPLLANVWQHVGVVRKGKELLIYVQSKLAASFRLPENDTLEVDRSSGLGSSFSLGSAGLWADLDNFGLWVDRALDETLIRMLAADER